MNLEGCGRCPAMVGNTMLLYELPICRNHDDPTAVKARLGGANKISQAQRVRDDRSGAQLIASAAIIGDSSQPVNGYSSSAASGTKRVIDEREPNILFHVADRGIRQCKSVRDSTKVALDQGDLCAIRPIRYG